MSRSAERVGFEPTEPGGSTVFKTVSFDHSDTSPIVGNRTQDYRDAAPRLSNTRWAPPRVSHRRAAPSSDTSGEVSATPVRLPAERPPCGIVRAVTGERNGKESGRKKRRSAKSAEARLAGGVACTFVFGGLWVITGAWFWLFPLAFAGLGPTIEGVLALRRVRAAGRSELRKAPDPEHEVLRVARAQHGRITASVVAVDTSLSIAEAEQVLDTMARAGHASMVVSDDGRIEYEFREFLPPPQPEA